MYTNAGNLKRGEFVRHLAEVWQIQRADFYSPGKGSALMKARIKNLVSGKNLDYAYKSNEQVEILNVESIEMQYLYKDEDSIYFMDERNYDQFSIARSVVGDIVRFFKEGEKMYVYVFDDRPLTVRPPMSVRLKVTSAEDAAKGDTVSNAKKSVTVETGATVLVPIFVKVGETISINPETGEYTGRV